MQVQNPDYKYNRIVNGGWTALEVKSESDYVFDCKCELTFSYNSFDLKLGDAASVKAYYSPKTAMDISLAVNFDDLPHGNEEFTMLPTKAAVCDANDQAIFKLKRMSYVKDGTVHAELTDLYKNADFELIFERNAADESQNGENEESNGWKCECGQSGITGKFCPNCGKSRP